MRIGVLALQGDFALHARALEKCGAEAVEVRKPVELDEVDGLIMPGGESTTLLKLIDAWDFVPALEKFNSAGKPIFGTCAGLILLAREVESPKQLSLGLIDVTVVRNAYGRQRESLEASGTGKLVRCDETIKDLNAHPRCVLEVDGILAVIPSYWVSREYAGAATAYHRPVIFECEARVVEDPVAVAAQQERLLARYQPEGGFRP